MTNATTTNDSINNAAIGDLIIVTVKLASGKERTYQFVAEFVTVTDTAIDVSGDTERGTGITFNMSTGAAVTSADVFTTTRAATRHVGNAVSAFAVKAL